MFSKFQAGAIAAAALVALTGFGGTFLFQNAANADDPIVLAQNDDNAAGGLDRTDVERIIREYLLSNPELMLEVQDALEEKQAADRLAAQQRAIREKEALIYSSEHQVEIGNPDAPITIVEFYDYNCGFCQRALEDMNRFIENDPQVRFVLKEFPVLGEPSLEAHKVSLAFARLYPEKAAEFHGELLSAQGRKDGDSAFALGLELGADADRLRLEAEKDETVDAIREVYGLADELGITGTPSYVIGDEVVFGAVGFDRLNEKVQKLKECREKVTC